VHDQLRAARARLGRWKWMSFIAACGTGSLQVFQPEFVHSREE